MRFLLVVALVAAFFLGKPASASAEEWKVGDVVQALFICNEVDPIVKFGKVKEAGAVALLQKLLNSQVCHKVPPGILVGLAELILKFQGLESGNRPIQLEVWRIVAKKDVYIGLIDKDEFRKRLLSNTGADT